MSILSKFAHKYEKNGYIARFNSLKNIPVFYKSELDCDIEKYLNSNCSLEFLNNEIEPIIRLFEKNKIIVDSREYDETIFSAIQNAVEEPYLSIMYLILTEKCNFNCSYCFIERNMDHTKSNVMTKPMAKKAIDFFVAQIEKVPEVYNDEKTIIFYGGEPLSNYDVLVYAAKLIREYITIGKLPEKTSMDLITNGSFITEEIAKELNELGVSISISLDGATKKANSCRVYHDGRIAYDDIIKGIENAKKAHVPFGLSITLSEQALDEKETLFDFLEKYKIQGIGYNVLNTDKTFAVKDGYFEEASQFIIDSFKRLRNKGISEDRITRKIESFSKHKLHYFDCGAEGGHQIIVAPNGDIGLCHGYLSTRKTFVTNVDDKDFNAKTNPLYLEWNKRTPFNMPQCKNCEAIAICGGGCALCAAENGDSIWDLDKGFCIHTKATLEFLVWDLFDIIISEDKNHKGL